MVLETESYTGGYSHNDYLAYQGPNGSYSNVHRVSQQTIPFSSHAQGSTHSSSHAQQHQSGWGSVDGFHSNGASHFTDSGYGSSYGYSQPVKPSTGGYGSSYGNSHSNGMPHGQGYGNSHSNGMPHGQGYGSPNSHGHGGYGNLYGYGGGAGHGSNGYRVGNPNYGHGSSGMRSHGSRILKGLDDEE